VAGEELAIGATAEFKLVQGNVKVRAINRATLMHSITKLGIL
jgi:hypothetical protein